MNTFDHPSLSIVKPVALFLQLPMMAMTICVCLFLFQLFCAINHFAYGTESCIEITAFLKSFTVFLCCFFFGGGLLFFLLQNGGRSDNSVSTVTQPSTLCTHVLTAALTTLYSGIRLGEFPILLPTS